jgi:3-hydroxybutyryl-CoA dehydrogenase
MEIKRIGVIGAGQMGNGIAHVAAQSGHDVIMMDAAAEALEKGLKTIGGNLDRQIKKGLLSENEKGAILGRIKTTTLIADLKDMDFVIEAATERETVKEKIFRDVDAVLKKEAYIASNTSSISITRLASYTKRPEKFIGMHFMNPVPVMKLVEVIRGIATSDDTFKSVHALATKMGKTIATSSDAPGFIVNRLLLPMLNEAVYALHDGVGDIVSIDSAMKLGAGHPMGPLQLADFIGLDTCLAIMRVLHEELGESKYRPCPLLVKYVEAGWLGKKTGKGFYDYADPENPKPTR